MKKLLIPIVLVAAIFLAACGSAEAAYAPSAEQQPEPVALLAAVPPVAPVVGVVPAVADVFCEDCEPPLFAIPEEVPAMLAPLVSGVVEMEFFVEELWHGERNAATISLRMYNDIENHAWAVYGVVLNDTEWDDIPDITFAIYANAERVAFSTNLFAGGQFHGITFATAAMDVRNFAMLMGVPMYQINEISMMIAEIIYEVENFDMAELDWEELKAQFLEELPEGFFEYDLPELIAELEYEWEYIVAELEAIWEELNEAMDFDFTMNERGEISFTLSVMDEFPGGHMDVRLSLTTSATTPTIGNPDFVNLDAWGFTFIGHLMDAALALGINPMDLVGDQVPAFLR